MRPYLRVANVFEDRIDTSDVMQMNFTDAEFETYRLAVGDILLNEGQSPELLGRPAMYRDEVPGACFTNTLVRFRAGPCVSASYALAVFRYYMHSGRFRAIGTITTNIAHLGAGRLSEVEFPVPPPNEQARIVATLDELFSKLDAATAALVRVRANLKRYRASVLKAAAGGRLTEEWRAKHPGTEPASVLLDRTLQERRRKWEEEQLARFAEKGQKPPAGWQAKYKSPAAPDTSDLPELPDGWAWASVEQFTTLVTKGTSPNWQGYEYTDDGVAFVRSQNVRWGSLDLSELAFLSPMFNETHRNSIIEAGDVLLNLVGASVGRSAVATDEIAGANLNQAVAIIRLVSGGMLNRLLVAFILSPLVQSHITDTKADVARANFNLDDIRPMPVPLPPLAEQTEIVAEVERRLSMLDAMERQVDAGLTRCTRLRQAVLKRAFEGNLVPQDPNDEPASVLLEMIREERRP
jgi:type I restriction enzyme S subunit